MMDNTLEEMKYGRNEYTITWFIENYSYCWHNNGEILTSSAFTTDGLDSTSWHLELYPRGSSDKSRSNISLFLRRSKYDDGPESLPLKYELSILALDGSALISREMEYTFKKGLAYGTPQFVEMDEVLLRRKTDFLPQGTLSVRCLMWRGEGNLQSITQFSALTRIGIKHLSFLHVVEGFSTLKPKEKKTIKIKSPSGNGVLSSSWYFLDDSCCKGKIMVEISPSSSDDILCTCKLFLLDKSGKMIDCGNADNRFDATREGIQLLPLSLSKMILLKRKSEYLPDDKLSLLYDCTFSTGVELKKIERALYQLPSLAVHQINNNDQNKDTYNTAEKLSACSGALDDFKAIYVNQFLTDVELKTKTKSFPAHKILLSARSSVFKTMLTNDRKDYTDCIQVHDLENDTVQQLLLFLYSDNLENLQWESVIKLYYAGNRYAIEKLKVLCSSFLINNLNTSTVVELLVLADVHDDADLMKFVENFILEHEEEVYSSDEWENLIGINPQLVSKTMHLKYKRKKEVNET